MKIYQLQSLFCVKIRWRVNIKCLESISPLLQCVMMYFAGGTEENYENLQSG
jgi:hypothetical protein